jgi:lipoprotein NlpD
MKHYLQVLYLLMLGIGIVSCGSLNELVQENNQVGWYTVKKSDTIYAIAWRYGLDYQQLARWNQITPDFIIYPGQRLRLDQPENSTLAAGRSKQGNSTRKAASTTGNKATEPIKAGNKKVNWRWPTSGKIMNTFAADELDRKGIDIAGKPGQAVRAVANGKVVYSGNGLAGYGNLIIIKHNDTYLSAYAYNQQRLVKEGMTVKGGTVISKMGQHPDGTTRLHFEIRKNGKPVDPLKYMPRL